MSHPLLSRRAFVVGAVPALGALAALRRARADERCAAHAAHAAHGASAGPHPTPRRGVDASRVLAEERLRDESGDVRTAFAAARRSPRVLDGIRCHCGCAERDGSYSLLSCFEGEGMARHCAVCQGQARLADRLHRAGRSLDAVRAAVDARFG